MISDEFREQNNAIGGLQVHHPRSSLPQPVECACEVDRLADNDRSDVALAHETAAVPARRESRDQNRVPVVSAASRIAERIRLRVERRILVLDPPVMPSAQEPAFRIEKRSSNRNPAFGQTEASFVQSDFQEM